METSKSAPALPTGVASTLAASSGNAGGRLRPGPIADVHWSVRPKGPLAPSFRDGGATVTHEREEWDGAVGSLLVKRGTVELRYTIHESHDNQGACLYLGVTDARNPGPKFDPVAQQGGEG